MEIGRIKWAGHSRPRKTEPDAAGCIIRLVNNEEMTFARKAICAGSGLGKELNDSTGRVVVFDVVPVPGKQTAFQADQVCYLEEVEPKALVKGLSAESLRTQAVRLLLQEWCPDILLGNDPCAYFPLLGDVRVREAFVKKVQSGEFRGNMSAAIASYFKRGKKVVWNAKNWELIDWEKEDPVEMRKMCRQAAAVGSDITPLLRTFPFLWREDKTFLKSLPLNTVQTFLLRMKNELTREDFKDLYFNVGNKWLQMLLIGMAPLSCILAFPQLIASLPDNRMTALIGEIEWEREDEAYIREVEPFLARVQHGNKAAIQMLVNAVTKRWIDDESPWWPLLPAEVKNAVLQIYKKEGVITVSNATETSQLERFLAEYYPRDGKRMFSIQQKEAIQAVNGVTLLFAVPGSGKTTVIVARAGYMVHGLRISPREHLIMTFGRSAAKEMEDRYKAVFPGDGDDIPVFRTIHSFCYNVVAELRKKGEIFPLLLREGGEEKEPGKKQRREREIAAVLTGLRANDPRLDGLIQLLNRRRFKQIAPQAAKETPWFGKTTLEEAWTAWQRKDITQKTILRQIMNTEAFDEEANVLIDSLATLIGFIKNRMLSLSEIRKIRYVANKKENPIEPIYTAYQQYLREENLMDFDDMLLRAYQGLEKYPDVLAHYHEMFPYVSLDETQDTSQLQHEIVALLVGKNGNLFMVGDDDQSIYSFRGAVPSEMLEFRRRYPAGRKLQMGTNYRSDMDIVRSADRFVKANVKRENKLMRPQSHEPGHIRLVLVPNLSAQYAYLMEIALRYKEDGKGDMAILFRLNASAFPVMACFYRNGIPFVCRKQQETIDAVLTRQEVKRIINLLRYSWNLSSMEAFRAAWFVCYRSAISKSDLKEIERIWQQDRSQTVANAVIQHLKAKEPDNVSIFIREHQDVLKISTSTPRSAIAFMLRQSEYGLLSESGENSINTWMRIYAVLSAAEMCSDIGEFLQMIDTMQNRDVKWHPFSKRICLSTMHSAKGAEFDSVILIDTLDEITPGQEQGNEVWYDAEEERRLFYVAVTRARHELDILESDIYHDRHLKPSRFIGDYRAENPCVEVVSYNDGKKRGLMRIPVTHYVIRNGPFAGIYSSEDEIDGIRKRGNVQVVQCASYADAIVCMHRGISNLNREQIRIPAEMPLTLTQDLWRLLGVQSAAELPAERIRKLADQCNKQQRYQEDGQWIREQAFLHFPGDLYKVWVPFMEMLPAARLPVEGRVKILVIGADSGAVTMGILQFYSALAAQNPGRTFSVEIFSIERQAAGIEVMKQLVKIPEQANLSVMLYEPICEEEQVAIRQFAGAEMDLIIEWNRLGGEQDRNRQTEFIGDICKALRNYGFFLMLEAEKTEGIDALRGAICLANKTDSLLVECMSCEQARLDVSQMRFIQDMNRIGLRSAETQTERFSYMLLERRDVEVRTR